jgi:hypothetical protein
MPGNHQVLVGRNHLHGAGSVFRGDDSRMGIVDNQEIKLFSVNIGNHRLENITVHKKIFFEEDAVFDQPVLNNN